MNTRVDENVAKINYLVVVSIFLLKYHLRQTNFIIQGKKKKPGPQSDVEQAVG